MPYYAVIRDAGPAWTDGGIAAQAATGDHAAYMNGLAEEGFVLFAGPLGGSEQGRLRVLLIVDASDEAEIHRRLEDDPWTVGGLLEVTNIEAWNVFVGSERLVVGSRRGAGGARQARLPGLRPGTAGTRSGAR
jgi:uncharacterized protein YciI